MLSKDSNLKNTHRMLFFVGMFDGYEQKQAAF